MLSGTVSAARTFGVVHIPSDRGVGPLMTMFVKWNVV
jgi:hypothetical protein